MNRIQRFCLQDGPGFRTTIFAQGCNLDCWWCHNPDSRAYSSDNATAWDVGSLADFVAREARYWNQSGGGVTVSGGECLVQAAAVADFLKMMQARGHHTCVETAGAVPWSNLIRVAPWVDLWLYDIKAVDPGIFRYGTGSNAAEIVLQNLHKLLLEWETPVIIRIPLIAGFNFQEKEIMRIQQFISKMPRQVPVEILPGHTVGCELGTDDPYPVVTLEQAESAMRDYNGLYNLNLNLPGGTQSSPKVLTQLIETFFLEGGQELQVNVLDIDQLKAARQNPERFQDLVVRIAGLNARFVELSNLEQEGIIRRAEAVGGL